MALALKLIDNILSSVDQIQSSQSIYDESKTDEKELESSLDFKNYLAIETVGGAYFHPSKDEIVFVYNASGLYQIYKTQINLKQQPIWPQALTYSNDRCTNPKYLKDATILYVSDVGGNEHFNIYLIDKNNITHKLSKDTHAKYRLSLCTKNYVYFSANINNKSKFDMYRQKLPLLKNTSEIICPLLSGIIGVNTVSPTDENIIIIGHYISNAHSELILIDMNNNGKQTMLTAKYNNIQTKQTFIWKAIRFIDNKYLLCISNYKCDFTRPIIININTSNIIYFKQIETSVQWDYEYFEFNDNNKYTYFTQNEHGYSVLYKCIFTLNDKTKGILQDLTPIKLPFKGVLSAGDQRSYTKAMSINSTNNLLTFTMSNSYIPKNMYVMDLNSMKCKQISYVSTPGVNVNNFVDCTLNSFKSFDELQVSYFRYKPKNNIFCRHNSYPTIIVIHGGPEAQYRPSFNSLIQFYAAAGFMIIAPNVRGSRGYGRTFMDADNIEKRLNSVRDIYELSQYLAENDSNVDSDRLIVYGGSYGGFMVLSSITEYSNVFICAVDIVGISNFVTFLQNTADWRRPLRESEYGSLKDDMDTLIKISPIHKIDNIKCPVFIIQGDNDERVPLSESIQIYEKLKEKELDAVLLRFDDEGHGVTKLKNKIVAYGRVLKWLINIVK